MTKEVRKKRYYKKDEVVWVIPLKQEGVFQSFDTDNMQVEVDVLIENQTIAYTFKPWEIDKYKPWDNVKNSDVKLSWAKVRDDAIIPTKRKEDAGYDIYANLPLQKFKDPEDETIIYEGRELLIPKGRVTFVPTGLASHMEPGHYLRLKDERGSVAAIGGVILAGLIDSTFPGEIQVMITPIAKDIVISDQVDKVIETEDKVVYPYKKAIAQAVFGKEPEHTAEEITYEDLLAKPRQRTGGWGSSGK